MGHVVIISESFWQSLWRDLVSLCVAILLFVPGLIMDSSAMQWIGGILFLILLVTRSLATVQNHRMTPQDAADWLAKEFDAKPDNYAYYLRGHNTGYTNGFKAGLAQGWKDYDEELDRLENS